MEKKLRSLKVVQHNQLITASYSMTLTEQRIVRFCITQIIRSKRNNSRSFVIKVADYHSLFKTGDSIKQLRLATKKLMGRYGTIETPIIDPDGKIWKEGGYFAIVEEAKFSKTAMHITFTSRFMEYLEGITGNYTLYPLSDIVDFKSSYAVRFYEVFRKSVRHGFVEIEVADIRKMFDLGAKYKVAADFRKRVIDAAIDDINMHSPLVVEAEPIRFSRKIVAYKFHISYSDSQYPENEQLEHWIEELMKAWDAGYALEVGGLPVFGIEHDSVSFGKDVSYPLKLLMIEREGEFVITGKR